MPCVNTSNGKMVMNFLMRWLSAGDSYQEGGDLVHDNLINKQPRGLPGPRFAFRDLSPIFYDNLDIPRGLRSEFHFDCVSGRGNIFRREFLHARERDAVF